MITKMLYLILLFNLIHTFESAASTTQADAVTQYRKIVQTLNQTLLQIQKTSSCPGAKLALTCGNGVCEAEKGENESTCPIDCLPTLVRSYNSQTLCSGVKNIFKPIHISEVQARVKAAYLEGSPIRMVGTLHTTNSQICTDGTLISTENLKSIVGIEKFEGKETVLVEPGVTIRDLSEWLHSRGRALGYGLVGYGGISLGGVVATAAHGSSPRHSAILSTAVRGITLVTGDGTIVEFSENTTDSDTFSALRAHLGMLGAIVRLRLEIRPQFNLDTTVAYESDEVLFSGTNPVDRVKDCDYSTIIWFPSSGKIVKTCGIETQKAADKGAKNTFLDLPVPSGLLEPFQLVLHYGSCFSKVDNLLEQLRFASLYAFPPFKKENLFHHFSYTTHVIGPSHRILSGELSLSNEAHMVRDWEVALPESEAPSALTDIRQYLKQNDLALPLSGVVLRFTPVEDKTLLSGATQGQFFRPGERVVFMEIASYHPIGLPPQKQNEYDQKYESIFKMLITKHHGRAHWGKNDKSIFELENQQGTYRENLNRFKRVMLDLDPHKTFLNEFGKEIISP